MSVSEDRALGIEYELFGQRRTGGDDLCAWLKSFESHRSVSGTVSGHHSETRWTYKRDSGVDLNAEIEGDERFVGDLDEAGETRIVQHINHHYTPILPLTFMLCLLHTYNQSFQFTSFGYVHV